MLICHGQKFLIDLLQRRTGMISNSEWITKLISMLSHLLRMLKWFMN